MKIDITGPLRMADKAAECDVAVPMDWILSRAEHTRTLATDSVHT